MKNLSILLIFAIFIFAEDKLLMVSQASIYPKLILLDKNYNTKLINNEILIYILYEDSDKEKAIKFKNFIEKKFPIHLQNYILNIKLSTYTNFNNSTKSTAIIGLNAKEEEYGKIVNYTLKNNIILFATNFDLLRKGALFFVNIEDKINIYLNKKILKEYKIRFKEVLYQITKEYSE